MTPAPETGGRDAADSLSQSPYYLPQRQAEEIFRRDIAPYLFDHAVPQDRPCAVVVIAQPGSGKTALTRALRERLAGDAVGMEVDGLKPFHPQLAALQRAVGEVAADEYVQADARRWMDMALDHVAGRRANMIVEQFPRSREMLDALVTRLVEDGYEVRAAVLTTPLAQSMQGVLLRYQAGHELGGGRDVPPDKQAERYHQLPQIADWLQADPRVSAVDLYRRDGTVVHENARDAEGRWNAGSSSQALKEERLRRWTVPESEAFLQGQASLADRMGPEWSHRIAAARTAAEGLLHPDVAGSPGEALDEAHQLAERARDGARNAAQAARRPALPGQGQGQAAGRSTNAPPVRNPERRQGRGR